MPIPYDLYIRFLATKGMDEIAQINKALQEIKLP